MRKYWLFLIFLGLSQFFYAQVSSVNEINLLEDDEVFMSNENFKIRFIPDIINMDKKGETFLEIESIRDNFTESISLITDDKHFTLKHTDTQYETYYTGDRIDTYKRKTKTKIETITGNCNGENYFTEEMAYFFESLTNGHYPKFIAIPLLCFKTSAYLDYIGRAGYKYNHAFVYEEDCYAYIMKNFEQAYQNLLNQDENWEQIKYFEITNVFEIYLKALKKINLQTQFKNDARTKYREYIKIKESEFYSLLTKKNRALLESYNIVLRHTFNFGIIGQDYVPPVEGYYNVGGTYMIGDLEVKEKKYKKYVKKGDYYKDVEGYTVVYQIINQSDNYYLANISVNGTAKFSNIVRTYWGFKDYTSKTEYEKFSKHSSIILKPNDKIKDQLIVGETIPTDFACIINKITKVSKLWVDELNMALVADDLNVAIKYLRDEKAKPWHSEILLNKHRIEKINAELLTASYLPSIRKSISPVNKLLFDKDFDSEVMVNIENTSNRPLMIHYSTPFGNYIATVKDKQVYAEKYISKGFSSNELYVKISKIEIQ